jgi:RimJ/RimL family protein N-acetyltransferase
MTNEVVLREVIDDDLPHFFEHQRDAQAIHMAAFTAKDPHDRIAFEAHWRKIRSDPSVTSRTIVHSGFVVGHIGSFDDEGRREITYWIAPDAWGRGYASEALRRFLRIERVRPLYARVASDNLGSMRVLTKHGFTPLSEMMSYANARDAFIAETLLELR